MTELVIISPGYAYQSGGVTDHTHRLLNQWTDWGHQVEVVHSLQTPETLWAELTRKSVAGVLLQYVPFLYGKRGVSTWPERILRMAKASGIRTTVFVHEPWVPPTRLPWLLLSPLQKRQLKRLSRQVDNVVTAVPAWAPLLGTKSQIIYVGSTLGTAPAPAPAPTKQPDLDSPVVFSPLAAGLNWEWIHAAAAAIDQPKKCFVIGATLEEALKVPSVARWCRLSGTWTGRLQAGDVLEHLSRAKLVLAPFIDGASGRRTSISAALSTGTQTLSSAGPLYDPDFGAGFLNVAKSKQEFVEMSVRLWANDSDDTQKKMRLQKYTDQLSPTKLDRELLNIVVGETP